MSKTRMLQVAGLLLVLMAVASGVSNTATNLMWTVGLVLLVVGGWRAHKAKKLSKI